MEREKYILQIFLAMLLLCYISSETEDVTRIISGKPATISQYPYLVSIRNKARDQKKFGAGTICGGSLISSVKVVTAAHCLNLSPSNSSVYVVILGIDRLNDSKNAVRSDVRKFKVHEKYKEFANDIAVIILANAVPANHPVIKPIKLPTATPKAGSMCQVAGWGRNEPTGKSGNELLAANVPIVGSISCRKMFPGGMVYPEMICAGGSGSIKGACHGDSGGPLTCNNELTGVVSWGSKCGDPNRASVYTNVLEYKDWINGVSERSVAVSPSRSYVIAVFYSLLISISLCFIEK